MPLNSGNFLNSIGQEALRYLTDEVPPLDLPCNLRHRLLMEDGQVYDFKTKSFARATQATSPQG